MLTVLTNRHPTDNTNNTTAFNNPAENNHSDSSVHANDNTPHSAPVRESRRAQVYHRGFLSEDRVTSEKVKEIADRMWALYVAGKVILTQRRLCHGVYEYLYRSVSPPHKTNIDYCADAMEREGLA